MEVSPECELGGEVNCRSLQHKHQFSKGDKQFFAEYQRLRLDCFGDVCTDCRERGAYFYEKICNRKYHFERPHREVNRGWNKSYYKHCPDCQCAVLNEDLVLSSLRAYGLCKQLRYGHSNGYFMSWGIGGCYACPCCMMRKDTALHKNQKCNHDKTLQTLEKKLLEREFFAKVQPQRFEQKKAQMVFQKKLQARARKYKVRSLEMHNTLQRVEASLAKTEKAFAQTNQKLQRIKEEQAHLLFINGVSEQGIKKVLDLNSEEMSAVLAHRGLDEFDTFV